MSFMENFKNQWAKRKTLSGRTEQAWSMFLGTILAWILSILLQIVGFESISNTFSMVSFVMFIIYWIHIHKARKHMEANHKMDMAQSVNDLKIINRSIYIYVAAAIVGSIFIITAIIDLGSDNDGFSWIVLVIEGIVIALSGFVYWLKTNLLLKAFYNLIKGNKELGEEIAK